MNGECLSIRYSHSSLTESTDGIVWGKLAKRGTEVNHGPGMAWVEPIGCPDGRLEWIY